jgi:hypothetical protein
LFTVYLQSLYVEITWPGSNVTKSMKLTYHEIIWDVNINILLNKIKSYTSFTILTTGKNHIVFLLCHLESENFSHYQPLDQIVFFLFIFDTNKKFKMAIIAGFRKKFYCNFLNSLIWYVKQINIRKSISYFFYADL